MNYFLQFSDEQCNMDMSADIADRAPVARQASMCSKFQRENSNMSLQLSDLEDDVQYAESTAQRETNAQIAIANPGGMWQAINKRNSVHEGERPAKRSKGSFLGRNSNNQTNMYQARNQWAGAMNTSNHQPFQTTRGAPQR